MAVTIKDIARIAGISYSTVSKALNGSPLVRESTRERISRIAQELGYQPNTMARSLVAQKSFIIGVVWPTIERLSWSSLVTSLNDALAQHGYSMLVSINPLQSAITTFNRLRVDGILVFPGHEITPFADLPKSIVPILLYGSPGMANYSSINANRRKAIFEAVSYLAARGHRKVAYIGDLAPNHIVQQEKFKGFSDGIIRHKLLTHPDMAIDAGGHTADDGYKAAKRLLQSAYHPSAIVSGSYELTVGIVRALRENNLRVPQDISIIAYDNIPQMERFDVPVTAVGPPLEAMAESIVNMLLGLISGAVTPPGNYEVDVELVERASVASRFEAQDARG